MDHRETSLRPGVLDLVTIASFVLSVLNVVYVVVLGLIVLLVGAGSMLAGPAVGLVGITVAGIVLAILLIQSVLSLVLFVAAWKTWGGQPGGRSLHKTWAWAIIVIDLIDMAFTGGIEPGAWIRLIYAVFVLSVMNRDDIVHYFARRLPSASAEKGPGSRRLAVSLPP